MRPTDFDCAYVKLNLPPGASSHEKTVQQLLWKRFIVFRNTQSILATALQSANSDEARRQQEWAIREMERTGDATGDAKGTLDLFLRVLRVLREVGGDPQLLEHTQQACQRWFERVWKLSGRQELSDKDLSNLDEQGIKVQQKSIQGRLCMRLLNAQGDPLHCKNKERRQFQWDGGRVVVKCWISPITSRTKAEANISFEVSFFGDTKQLELRLEVNSDWGVKPPSRRDVILKLESLQAIHETEVQSFDIPVQQDEQGRVWVTLSEGTQLLECLTVHLQRATSTKKAVKKTAPAQLKKPSC